MPRSADNSSSDPRPKRRAAAASLSPARAQPRGKVTDDIIRDLQRDIASGALPRGDRLPNERDLALHFDVSQPTIREALRALDAMGLIDVRHGSGAYVTGDSHQLLATSLNTLMQIEKVGILDVLEVRSVLGLVSARRAAERATPADIDEMTGFLELLSAGEQQADVQAIAEAAVSFQTAVSAAAHNPLLFALESFLIRLLMQFQLAAKAKRGPSFWREWTIRFDADRRRLVSSLAAHNEKGTVKAMSAYLDDQRELFSSDRDLTRLRLTDPEQLNVLADTVLNTPDLRPVSTE